MKTLRTMGALALCAVVATGFAAETKAEKDARMKWWREARFGMFIHWGLYAIPAGKWGDRTGHGEWIRDSARIPLAEYAKFKDQWNPTKFDAKQWAKIAKDAGMKYVVLTSKHHDGFDLFPTKQNDDWNVAATPNKRDILRELSGAVRGQGLKIGWYHSIMDWHHPDYLPRRTWETDRPTEGADFDRFVAYLRAQVTEVMKNYGPISVMWFDGEWESTWSDRYGKPLYDLCRTIDPNVIVNNRVSNSRGGSMEDTGSPTMVGDYSTPEQFIPATGNGADWETCMTMNDHWGYNAYDQNWKSSRQLIRNLVDIASKGGNYLLNVGPKADGTFPDEAIERLRDIGRWMKTNGNSIYGTTASLFADLPWGRSTTKVDKGTSTLYFHVFDWPKDGRLVVPGLGNEPKRATILEGNKRLKVVREGSDLVLSVPSLPPDANATTVSLEVAGEPIVYKTPTIDPISNVLVDKLEVPVSAGSAGLEVRYTLDGKEPTVASRIAGPTVTVTETGTLKVASFHLGKKVSGTASASFEKVVPTAGLPADPKWQPGLFVQEFKGSWEKVPDFAAMAPRGTLWATEASIDFSNLTPEESVGRRYTGFFHAPVAGVYRFALTADDGAVLWVAGKPTVDNDGLHSPETKTGAAALGAGWHPIEIRWFNATGAAALQLRAALAGKPMELVGEKSLSAAKP